MKNLLLVILVICSVCILDSCTEMDDKHKSYFENGEIIYVGKVDSFKVFPGDERMLLQYWISDPRVKSLNISWLQGKDSLDVPVPVHQPAESFERYIGKNDKTITEGSHTFKLVTWDEKSHKSVVVETNAKIYGQQYRSRLTNRSLVDAETDGNDVTLTWKEATGNEETGIIVSYINTSGDSMTQRYTSSEATTNVIPDVKLTAPMMVQTLYLPEPTAIDTFAAEPQKISIHSTPVNVVLNAPPATLAVSSILTADGRFLPSLAVDGNRQTNIINGDFFWASADNFGEHWFEIDLQGTVEISALRLWRSTTNNPIRRTQKFSFQVWQNSDWVDVLSEENNDAWPYYKEFEPVSTTKVRWYVPAYENNRTFLCEIEVYKSMTWY